MPEIQIGEDEWTEVLRGKKVQEAKRIEEDHGPQSFYVRFTDGTVLVMTAPHKIGVAVAEPQRQE